MKNINLFTFNRSEAQKNTSCASVNVSNASPRRYRDVTETLPRRYGWAKLAATLTLLLTLSVGQMWANNEYNKRYLYVNSSNCSWWTNASSQPALDTYFNTDCSNDWAAFQGEASGALTSTSWYFDLSGMHNSYLYFRGFKIQRHPKNTSDYWNAVTAGAENNGTHNCLWINSDGNGMSWGNYAVPISSITLSATSGYLSGSGTSGDPYLVPVGTSISLSASPSCTPADGTMSFCANFGTSPGSSPTTVTRTGSYSVASTSKVEVKCKGRNKYGDVYSADVTSNSIYVQGVVPSVGVSAAGSVTTTTATLNATVTVNGATTTAYGFKYGTTNNVTTLKNSGTNASTSGALAADATSFSKSVTGLSASTTYYYISYVTTASETYYSASAQSFTTSAAATYNLSVEAGTGISAVTGSTNNISASQNIAISATVATGYTWSTWTKTGTGTLSTFTPGTKDQTVTVGTVGDITLTASATENMSSLSTSCHYDAGNPSYAAPSVSGSATTVGYATTRTITATAAGTGYTFAGWTLTNCTRTDGGGATANPIIISSNGDGAAASVVANYKEDLSSPYTIKGGTNLTGDNWVAHAMTKKTGHSTESVAYYTFSISSTNAGISGSADDWSFKILKGETWYGLAADGDSYWWQSSTSANQSLLTSGKNIQICANVAGPYEIKVDYTTPASPKVTVTFPTSYTLTYGIGTVKGNDGSISTSPSTASGSKVISGTNITLTAPAADAGYEWKGWYTNAAGTEGNITDTDRAITVTMDADKTLYACYTENTYTVSVASRGNGTVSPTSLTGVGPATKSADATASADIGYQFTGWTLPSGISAADGYNQYSNPIKVNATAASSITANFDKTYAYIEGRFHVTNSARNGTWTNTFANGGNWNNDATNIKFSWDGTNNRFCLHTYATPQELTYTMGEGCDDCNPYFYIKTSTSSSSLTNVTPYWSTSAQEITTVGSANKKALVHSGNVVNSNLKFNSSDESGYVILYFDQASVWYELEQSLEYNGNGNTGGSGTAKAYYNKGTNATAATNAYTRDDYRFTGWNTQADGKGTAYAAGASVPMNSNITLYAQWEPIPFTVTVNDGAHGTVTPHGSVETNNVDGVQISASSVPGWVFSEWEVSGTAGAAVVSDTHANPATLKAIANGGTVTANYIEANVIYFKDVLGWGDAYAYLFSADPWSSTDGVQPITNLLVSGRMSVADAENNVYKFEFNKSYTPTHIAFSKDNKISESYFNNTEGVCRGDYSTSYPMFVPSTTSNETKQGTKYYNDGDWFAYSTDKGYYICYNSTDYPLVFTSPGSLTASLATLINLPADYTNYTISVKRVKAGTTTYGSSTALDHAAYMAGTKAALVTSPPTLTMTTLAKGDHNFTLDFSATVTPQLAVTTVPAAYQITFGAGNGGDATTAKRSGDIAVTSGDYVAPGTTLTFNQTPHSGCEFVKWNTMRNGMGEDLGNSPQLVITMPSAAQSVYPLYRGELETSWQIAGSFNNWEAVGMHQKSVGSIDVIYKSITLAAGKEYEFKLIDAAPDPDVWYSNTGTMTQAHCTDWTFESGVSTNCKLVSTIAGSYDFVFNTSTKKLSIVYPTNSKQATMYDSPVRDNNGDVMIQAFYWAHVGNTSTPYTNFGNVNWSDLATEADTLAKYFNLVWLAPSQETADFTGYLPMNYSHQGTTTTGNLYHGNSPWGSASDLRTLIDNLHNAGAKVVADIVLNHSSAGHPDEYTGSGTNWCTWTEFNFGRYGSYSPDYTWLAKGDEMFYGKKTATGNDCGYDDNTDNTEDEWTYSYNDGTASWSESEFNCSYSRDWAHNNLKVKEMSRAYLTWMRDSIGYDGWRWDFMKGFHASHLFDYNRASGPYFSVAEVFDGDIAKQLGVLKDANYSTYMFDFPGKFSIYNSAIREYQLQNLKNNSNTLIYSNKKYAVTFIDNHDSFHEEGKSMHYNANTIDDRQAHQALAYLLSMPGVPCVFYPYWNNYKDICKKLIFARKAAGVNSESDVEEDWAGDGSYGNNYYTARIKGSKGYLFLKLGTDCTPTDPPYGSPTAPDGKTYVMAWGNSNAAVWYTTSDTEPTKYRLLVTCNDETYYSNSVTNNGDTLSYYANPSAKYQWQKYELFEWHNVAGTTPAAVSAGNVYTATFDSLHVEVANVAPYTGTFYIRTDGASGGWNDYMASNKNNKFTYFSNVSVATGDPYHYYWVENIAKNNTVNVKGQVANRFNKTITNELDADSYTNATCCVIGDSHGINIRFSYEPTTNKLGRTMILGSTENDFLNIIGSNIYKDQGGKVVLDEALYAVHPEESKLGDISDWVYEKSVYVTINAVTPTSNVVIKSMFKTTPSSSKQEQYMLGYQKDFYGNDTDDPLAFPVIAAGTTEGTYRIRIIYDFKTNRLTGAWEPTDMTISTDQDIDADVLFIRHEDDNTAQITITSNKQISSIKHVLFVLEMERDVNAGVENHYWFSLPFDCQICNIFGLEGYMTYWGIQEYDGKTRAQNGWYLGDGVETFWRWMDPSETLKAGVGYVVHVDKPGLTWATIDVDTEVCDKSGQGGTDTCYISKVPKAIKRLYFPSDNAGFNMSLTGVDQEITYDDWTCEKKNRKAQDSNWRLLSAANYNNTTIRDYGRTENDSVLDKAPDFIYTYDGSKAANHRYTAVDAKTSFTYKSFNCYMAQFSGTINWSQFTQGTPQSIAARRRTASDVIERANLYLEMVDNNNVQQDFTYIYLRENATYGFDQNKDLTKIVYPKANQVYSVNYSDVDTVSYVANVLPTESQRVRLTVNVNKAGSYTFRMPNGTDYAGVVLVDTELGKETDLSLWSYTVELPKGNYSERFYIEIDVRKTPTVIDITNPDELDENGEVIQTVKFMRNGLLYLRRGDKLYDSTGRQIE